MSEAYQRGKAAEALAADYLRHEGLVVLDQHYMVGHLEIDIIALDGEELVIVEVKERPYSVDMALIDEVIDHKKRQRLIVAADTYASECQHPFADLRFDYIFVTMHKGREPEVIHLPRAFVPTAY